MSEEETNRGGESGDVSGLTLRLFFAVELPSWLRAAAASHAAGLRQEFPGAYASWTRPESLHLTLKFLGEVEPAIHMNALHQAAETAKAGVAPFTLTISGAGTFPPRGAARVLWLGVGDDEGQLARLHFRLDRECGHAGFPLESKPFKPHLTLARLRQPQGAQALSEAHRGEGFGPFEFDVREFVLMRSRLGPGGSRYTPMARHFLENRTAPKP
jgi:2'-5' RNA ligase